MNVLLHACCGPCASACIARLKEAGHQVTLYYSNSNIDTEEEFVRRLASLDVLAKAENVPLIVDEYDHETWLREVARGYETAPEKGPRCARCFAFNLRRAALYAEAHGFDAFTTSLTVSPHKVSAVIFEQARANEIYPNQFLAFDFKKKNGFLLSVHRAKELGLYCQTYCGCEFSRRFRAAD